MRWRLLRIIFLIAAFAPPVVAHEARPAYLELRQTAVDTFDVLWKVPALGDTMRLGLYVRLPETCETLAEPRGRFTADAYIERWRIRHAKALVAFFALFHGHAHGTELPAGQSGLLYSVGFVIATGLLHAVGIGIGTLHRWPAGRVLLRTAGAGVLVGGLFFLGRSIGWLA